MMHAKSRARRRWSVARLRTWHGRLA